MVSNGRLDAADLGYVSGHRVLNDLVSQTAAMIEAAARDGVTLRITQAYRTYAQQVQIFTDRYTPRATGSGPFGDVRFWNGVRYVRTSGAAAAVPGESTHGKGQAIDFATDSPGAIAWLTKNGAKYGWYRPAWTFRAPTIEPWHWEAIPVLVSNPGDSTGTVPTVPDAPAPIPGVEPIQEDDMRSIITDYPGTPLVFLVSGDLTTKRHLHNGDIEIPALEAAGAVRGQLSAATIDMASWVPCHDGRGNPVANPQQGEPTPKPT